LNKITFDDGLLNTYEVAYPIMSKHGVKGTLFVVTGVLKGILGDSNPFVCYARKLNREFMSMEHVLELKDAGWEIGSHSVTHTRFDLIPNADSEWELIASKKDLMGAESFAFPYGHGYYTKEQVDLARKHFRTVRTVCDSRFPQMVDGVPIDSFPPVERLEGNQVYVIHMVMDPVKFEEWIKTETQSGEIP